MVRGAYNRAMTVPLSGLAMNPQKYRQALESRLSELVEADPEEAKELLTASPESSPNLYQIGMSTTPQDWPAQIMMCDQMLMFLDQISYLKGRSLTLQPSEMPSLREIVETI